MKTNTQPVIGITMCLDKDDFIRQGVDYSYIRREYGQEVRAAGGQPIFLDNTIDPEVAAGLCDGIVITGGHDIEPSVYGNENIHAGKLEPRERTEWELKLIDVCDMRGVQILGVCYGMQLLNVHYGGTLYQDISTEQGTSQRHGASEGADMLPVTFAEDFLSFRKGDTVETAHRHHQSVRDLGNGIAVIASTEDGIVEAIAGHGHYGIQWHAESDGSASGIYVAFVAHCAGRDMAELLVKTLPEAV